MKSSTAFAAIALLLLLAQQLAAETIIYEDPQSEAPDGFHRIPVPDYEAYEAFLTQMEQNQLTGLEHGENARLARSEMERMWPEFREEFNKVKLKSHFVGDKLKGWAETEQSVLALPRAGAAFFGAGQNLFNTARQQGQDWSTGTKVAVGGASAGVLGAGALALALWKKGRANPAGTANSQQSLGNGGGTIRIRKDQLRRSDPNQSGIYDFDLSLVKDAAVAAAGA